MRCPFTSPVRTTPTPSSGGHEQVRSTLEYIMANVPESEDSDEPMNWKAAPEHFLTYIWTENEKNPEKNFMSDAGYSRRPVSDEIQAAIEYV